LTQQGRGTDESGDCFGDWRVEVSAWIDGVVVTDESSRICLRATGLDTPAFLSRLSTFAVDKLEPGQGARPFLLDARGRIKVVFDYYCLDERTTLISCDRTLEPTLRSTLDMYHFGEDFELVDDARLAIGLGGSRAHALLEDCGVVVPSDPWAHCQASLAKSPCHIFRDPRYGQSFFTIWVKSEHRVAVWETLRSRGAVAAGRKASEFVRICAGRPAAPGEFSGSYTPLDVGGMDGITDGKGCYPGQEVIERTIAIGRPAVRLVGLFSEAPLVVGQAIKVEDAAVGTVTSVSEHSDAGWVGLATIKTRHSQADHWLIDEKSVTARSLQ
jgi:folate-binding protein YgfZ